MQYYSLKNTEHKVSFKEALINGLAPDGGLYFPEKIPVHSNKQLQNFKEISLAQIAEEVLFPYMTPDFTREEVANICQNVFTFDIPLNKVEENIYVMELFHGPTLAFKDVGARFLAQCMQTMQQSNKVINVMVATSGDTGSAVASAFYGLTNVNVHVLYPENKVSLLQLKQFASLGNNVHTLAIDGTFDDCQRLVKQAFADANLKNTYSLTSANSINIGRWLPQMVYYYSVLSMHEISGLSLRICVPSGNLGNITSGILAWKSGLPVHRFVAACNANKVIFEYLKTGEFRGQTSLQTIANAMDVGNPNNIGRMDALFEYNFFSLSQMVQSEWFSDVEISQLINDCKRECNYVLDPHAATAYGAIKKDSKVEKYLNVFLGTAHPAKFKETVEEVIGCEIDLPAALEELKSKPIFQKSIAPDLDALKQHLFEACN